MKKKILKITALVFAVALILGVCFFANSLVGNPLSKALATGTAEKYIEEVYGDTDYELEDVSYSFKDGYYHAYVVSPSSLDTHFTLLINGFGVLRYDNYEYNVTNGWNTANRLDMEYRKAVDVIFDSKAFPYRTDISFGELIFIPEENKEIPDVPEYALITNELTPDAYYNVSDLGARAGKLTVYLDDTNVSAERLAEVLLEIRKCFDDAGLGFYTIDCVLEYPLNETEVPEVERFEVMDFLYRDIHEEGLVERVEASNQAAMEYYYTMDAEKGE